jgi:hypothetical protein
MRSRATAAKTRLPTCRWSSNLHQSARVWNPRAPAPLPKSYFFVCLFGWIAQSSRALSPCRWRASMLSQGIQPLSLECVGRLCPCASQIAGRARANHRGKDIEPDLLEGFRVVGKTYKRRPKRPRGIH